MKASGRCDWWGEMPMVFLVSDVGLLSLCVRSIVCIHVRLVL